MEGQRGEHQAVVGREGLGGHRGQRRLGASADVISVFKAVLARRRSCCCSMHVPCLLEISVLSNLIFCSLKFDGYVGVQGISYLMFVSSKLDVCSGWCVGRPRCCRGDTPLHRAAYRGSVESAKLLLAAKASVDVKNWDKSWGPQPMSQTF